MTQSDQINECEKQLLEAMKTSNILLLDKLLHDDLVFNIPTGQTITKSMDIENYQSGVMKVLEILITDKIIKIVDDIGTVCVTIYLKAEYKDQIIDGKFRYLRVWKLFDKSWKVIAGSVFPI